MKDYKQLHRPNPYRLPHQMSDERILNWGSLIVGLLLVVLVFTGVIA